MKKVKKKIISISSVLLAGILLLDIYQFISLKVLKQPLSTFNGYALLEVVSSSMYPTIEKGDYILISTKDKNYHKKDIVTFYDKEDNLVTHRIVSVSKKGVITKGDFNPTNDSLTVYSSIVGKYVFRIPNAGIIVRFFKNPIVIAVVIIIIFGISYLTAEENYDLYQEFLESLEKENKEENVHTVSHYKGKKNNNKRRKKRARRKQRRG